MSSKVNFGHPKWPIDLTWPEMRWKVIFGHPKWPPNKKNLYRSEMARIAIKSEFQTSKMADQSEMARNAIESDFRTCKMADGSHFVKNIKTKLRLRSDLKWPEMRSKVNFGHPKWPTAAIISKQKFQKKKVAYRSEMARNATFKMGAGCHFAKKKWQSFVLIWNGQKCHRKWISDIQNGRRQPFCKKITKINIVVLIWNGKKWFLDIQNGYRWSFKKKHLQKKRTDCWPTTTWYKFTFGQYIYRHVCRERGNIHCVRPLGRMHTILVNSEISANSFLFCY